MMRTVKRIICDLFCRRNRSCTNLIVVGFILFLIGNYFLLRTFSKNSGDQLNRTTKEGIYKIATESKNEKLVEVNEIRNAFKEFKITHESPKTIEITEENVAVTQPPEESKTDAFKDIIEPDIVLLVMACNRVEIRRCLDKIFDYLPEDKKIPVIVSQDCGHQGTAEVIKSYGNKLEHIKQPDLGPVKGVPNNMYQFMGYYKISRHYKWALSQVFERKNVESVIIVEDDIDISPDFFEYFLATQKLLAQDKTLYCISAWNDNGKEDSVDSSAIDILYRSDFFPGLGWMMSRSLWNEIGSSWPKGFWDDWIRANKQRKDRACIRPEISRTKTFGRIGVSRGQFYDQYLQYIKLNSEKYPFRDYDLSYLSKETYDENFLDTVYSVPEGSVQEVSQDDLEKTAIRLTYKTNGDFENLARRFGIMSDFKDGVPRTAYRGVVTFYRNKKRVYLAPPKDWNGYKKH